MSAEDLKALVRRFIEEMNKGRAAAMAVIDELFATDLVCHRATGEDIHGLKDYKQINSEFYKACPDLHITIEDMVAEGDKVACRWTLTGTHKGEYMGAPPTNKKITIRAITIRTLCWRQDRGRMGMYDTLSLMQQLGLAPTPKKGK